MVFDGIPSISIPTLKNLAATMTLTFNLLVSKHNIHLCPQLHLSCKCHEIPISGL